MEGTQEVDLKAMSEFLSCNEIAQVPVQICKKIEVSLKTKFDNFITMKAVFEKNRKNADEKFNQLTKDYEIGQCELKKNQDKLNLVEKYASELQSQLEESRGELLKLQDCIKRLEKENIELRKQKDIFNDENNTLHSQIERKDIELERLKTEVDSYGLQLQNAVTTKCQALAQIEELQSREMSLDFKEKRLEQERILLSQQISNLEEELSKRTSELQKTRSEMSTHTLLTQTRLSQCEEELKIKSESVIQLREANSVLQHRNEDLVIKLEDQRNHELSMHASYREEITAQIRLADLYKGMADESNVKANDYSNAVKELQDLLEHATEQYGLLESKYTQVLLDSEQESFIKQKKIDELVKEIHRANELLRSMKQEQLDQAVEQLAPTAAIASKILKRGLSLTQIYTQLVETTNELSLEREEKEKLKSHMEIILKELEEKAPILQQQRTDYETAIANVNTLTLRLDELLTENNQLQRKADEASKLVNYHSKESQRLKCELADLARQVCYLLKEVQESRTGHALDVDDSSIVDIGGFASSKIISKKLVTFKDIEELQENNQRLLSVVRILSSKQEEIEKATEEINSGEIKEKLDRYVENLAEMQEAQERQSKMLEGLLKQRDMYKSMYQQSISKSLQKENDITFEYSKNSDTKHDSKTSDYLIENKKFSDEMKHLSEKCKDSERKFNQVYNDFEIYKKEKLTNEKMLNDEIERLRKETEKSSIRSCRLKTQLDSVNERFCLLQGNVANYKSQIKVLEEKCTNYSTTIGKHEQSLMILKDEALSAQRKLSKAEVQLENMKQECQLLRNAEGRLLKEREVMQRERHTHALLKADIEAIKTSLERSNLEGQLRTEQRLDDATRECAALRRRLQEEQDRFRELTVRMERQVKSAQARLSEEKGLVERIQGELEDSRSTEQDHLKRIDELNVKLKEVSMQISSKPIAGDDNIFKRLQTLEIQLASSQAEAKSLSEQLKASRFQSQQYCDIAESAESQFREASDEFKRSKEQLQQDLISAQEEARSLKNTVHKLENNIEGFSNDQIESNSELKKQLAEAVQKLEEVNELQYQLDVMKGDLKNASSMASIAEDKYTKEMLLHSTDLQTLSKLKEELNVTVAKISELEEQKNLAVETLAVEKSMWSEREKRLSDEVQELQKRVEDFDAQNILLHNQIQELSERTAIQNHHKISSNDILNPNINIESINRSIFEDDSKSVEQLLQIIKYVRREKDLAVAKFDVLKSENARLKSQAELADKCCEETKRLLDREREHTEIDIVTTSKHSELLRKVETLNAITDSNRILREERDSLNNNIKTLVSKLNLLSDEITPLREKTRSLESKNDTLQQENSSLKAEAMRWRQRANHLIERSNKASPEDWRRLQTERENLSKLLTSERETHSKCTDELNSLKNDKNRLEEQINQMQRQLKLQEEQISKLTEENQRISLQSNDCVMDLKEKEKVLTNLKKELSDRDALLADVKNKEIQIRKIAKKYKTQYEELAKNVEEEKSRADDGQLIQVVGGKLPIEDDMQISHERESQLKEESRLQNRQVNIELNSKVDELTQQILVLRTESENLKKEIEIINKASLEKEERAKQVLKGARTKIMQLTEYKKLCEKEMHELKEKLDSSSSEYESNINEYEARLAALKSQMEGRIQRLEHERIDLQSEKETLLQRAAQLQRQLAGQSNLSTVVSEPPTANIKPMSSRAETPLASIRPMSVVVQSRTAAVLPTTAGAPLHLSSQQSQQLVHTTETSSPTSSHMDYQPASTSRQLLLQPQINDSAESTQREETEVVEPITVQQQQQCQQLTVALVIPRVEQQQQAQILSNDQQQTVPSSSTQSVSTSHAALGHKRPRSLDSSASISNTNENIESPRQEHVSSPKTKRNKQEITLTQTSASDIEYQVPTSSQRDQDEEGEDGCIVVDCDEGGIPQDEEEFDNDQYEEMEEEEIPYGVEVEGDNNEVEVTEESTSTELTRQVQSSNPSHQQQQSETISSAGHSTEAPSFARLSRGIIPLSRQQPQQHLLLPQQVYEDAGDDCIVPSTPTLFIPRRNDGFGEAINSPQTSQNRFTFGDSTPASTQQSHTTLIVTGGRAMFNPTGSGLAQVVQEGMDDTQIDLSQLKDNKNERSASYNTQQVSPTEPPSLAIDEPTSKQDIEIVSTEMHINLNHPDETTNTSNVDLAVNAESDDHVEIITHSPGTDVQKSSQKLQDPGTSLSASRDELINIEVETHEDPSDEIDNQPKDENREAEASPSSNTRQRTMAAAANITGTTVLNMRGATARRSGRTSFRSARGTRPTPIVWDNNHSPREQGVVRGHATRGTANEVTRARGARSRRMRSKYPYNY